MNTPNTKAFLTSSGKLFRAHYIIEGEGSASSFFIIAKNEEQIEEWFSHRSDQRYEFQLVDGRVEFCFGEIDLGNREKSFERMLELSSQIENK